MRQTDLKAYTKQINLSTDALWLVLLSPSYTPNYDTHILYSDVSGFELASGGGYTPGGIQLTGQAISYVTAASWSYSWAASTPHVVDDVVRPSSANGFLYRYTGAGTSGSSAPAFPTTPGVAVADGTATLECVGSGVTQISASNVTWGAPFTAGPARYAALIDKTPGTPILIGLSDFGSSITGQSGAFSEQWNAEGIFLLFEQ
ncbi:hypothetical protein LQ327_09055 [Actinomycetospora endophytica]|uniref:Uncharacterized protein n=1 Tax=Actinomycetospora endophytica TaxID=2291215 RepID=A0ABS8P5J7_9PSEU|nr:hypothetical protein [Actinomycetospora endophytica]MCD2193530.1 hypothetical protein [Actinomycetospora endophytica]